MRAAENIVVTGSRVAMQAQQEDLGDLKLYRIPEPVTVAAKSQKQVAMLEKKGVKVERVYRAQLFGSAIEQQARTIMILRTKNRAAEGLGVPLPAGGVALFGAGHARPILLGQGSIADKAVGEDVEIEVAESTGVVARVVKTGSDDTGDFLLTVTNDQDRLVRFEADFADVDVVTEGRIGHRNGRPSWSATVPANGSMSLRYRLRVRP
jgi:hypothetical protein